MTAEEAVLQWEPQANLMARRTTVQGMDYDDIMQEMRVVIVRAWETWDERREASFHTYLYRCMENRVRSLITASNRQKRVVHQKTVSLHIQQTEEVPVGESLVLDVNHILPYFPTSSQEDSMWRERMWQDALKEIHPTPGEMVVIDLLLCGYGKGEIRALCVSPRAFDRVLRGLKEKMRNLGYSSEGGGK